MSSFNTLKNILRLLAFCFVFNFCMDFLLKDYINHSAMSCAGIYYPGQCSNSTKCHQTKEWNWSHWGQRFTTFNEDTCLFWISQVIAGVITYFLSSLLGKLCSRNNKLYNEPDNIKSTQGVSIPYKCNTEKTPGLPTFFV